MKGARVRFWPLTELLILLSKILRNEQRICSVTNFYFNICVIPASSVVASQDSLSRGSGMKPLYLCWDKGGNLANKSKSSVWPTVPDKDL